MVDLGNEIWSEMKNYLESKQWKLQKNLILMT